MIANSKLNSIDTLISQALMDLEISHEQFKTTVDEKEKYEKMKENIRNIKINDGKYELSENNKNIRNIMEMYKIKKIIFFLPFFAFFPFFIFLFSCLI